MFNCILVRYGEIALKFDFVRRRFEKRLVRNIKTGLKSVGLECPVKRLPGRVLVEGYSKKSEAVLKRVFGVVSFSPCLVLHTDLEKIKKESVKLARKTIKKADSFAVDCNRTGNHPFGSQDVERAVGAEIVKAVGCKVDLTKPDKVIGIDIRDQKTYLFSETTRGSGGIPVGTQGIVVCLVEDFNGVIASWLFMKRGCFIVPVFSRRSKKLLGILDNWSIGFKLKPYFLKKKSIKAVEKIAIENRASAIVTGELLSNFKQVGSAFAVFRPLVGFDKVYLGRLRKSIENT